jgi:hypothetical protein
MMKAKRQITELQFAEEVVPPLATALGDDIVSTSFTSFSEGVHELTRSQPDDVPPIINADWCLCGNGTNSPRDLRSVSTSARLPLTRVQHGPNVELLSPVFHSGRRVVLRINTHRDDDNIFSQSRA